MFGLGSVPLKLASPRQVAIHCHCHWLWARPRCQGRSTHKGWTSDQPPRSAPDPERDACTQGPCANRKRASRGMGAGAGSLSPNQGRAPQHSRSTRPAVKANTHLPVRANIRSHQSPWVRDSRCRNAQVNRTTRLRTDEIEPKPRRIATHCRRTVTAPIGHWDRRWLQNPWGRRTNRQTSARP